MTDLIERVKAALENATPGRWVTPYDTFDNGWSLDTDGENSSVGVGVDCYGMDRPIAITAVETAFGKDHILDANATLIALAPDMARALVAAQGLADVLNHLRGAYDCSDVVDPALATFRATVDDEQ